MLAQWTCLEQGQRGTVMAFLSHVTVMVASLPSTAEHSPSAPAANDGFPALPRAPGGAEGQDQLLETSSIKPRAGPSRAQRVRLARCPCSLLNGVLSPFGAIALATSLWSVLTRGKGQEQGHCQAGFLEAVRSDPELGEVAS